MKQPIACNDPKVRDLMRWLGIPGDCTGFTVSVKVNDVVRVSVDLTPAALVETNKIEVTHLTSTAKEYVFVAPADTLDGAGASGQ